MRRVRDVAHELNNSLAPIIMSVQLLRRRTTDPDIQRRLDLVAGHAWKGAELAQRLLALVEGPGGAKRARRENGPRSERKRGG